MILTDEVKVQLRMQRQELGIDSQEHLLLLNKLGWTLDDYEVSKFLYECCCIGPNWFIYIDHMRIGLKLTLIIPLLSRLV